MKKTQQGFTLIELMIVVAIIGILAAVAIPAYSDYMKRAKASEMLTMASSAKTGVSEYYLTENAWPTSNASAGLPSTISTDVVASLSVGTNGVITITGTSEIDSMQMTLTPRDNGAGISWECTSDNAELAPASCR